jgi:thymidine phosphorylase
MTDTTQTVDKKIGQYVAMRDALKKMDERHVAERAPLLEVQSLLAGWLLQFLKDNASEAVKTKHGTVYATTKFTASIADPEAFMQHVIETEQFDLLDRRANATAVKDYVASHKQLPPGCNLNSHVSVGVRRA